jgi:hypothetical protein
MKPPGYLVLSRLTTELASVIADLRAAHDSRNDARIVCAERRMDWLVEQIIVFLE